MTYTAAYAASTEQAGYDPDVLHFQEMTPQTVLPPLTAKYKAYVKREPANVSKRDID